MNRTFWTIGKTLARTRGGKRSAQRAEGERRPIAAAKAGLGHPVLRGIRTSCPSRRRAGGGWAVAAILVVVAAPGWAQTEKKKAKVQKTTAGAPVLKYEQFRQKIEFKVDEKRDEQIEGLKRLIKLGPAESELPDLKFRLAELYFEKSQFFFFRGQESEDRAGRASSEGEKAALLEEKNQKQKESKKWLQQALDLYVEIRDRYPKYQRMPEVLFALGQSYWSEGRFKDAIDVYADLIRHFKDSPLVSEAWLAFGEYYFAEGDVNKAIKSYEKAAEDKRSRVYGFALYKQGWCYYNLSEWEEALKKFKATVLYSQLAEQLSGENKIALGREAQKDYVLAYSHVGTPERAKIQFADLVGADDCNQDACISLLERLAGLWYDEGYFAESAQTYRMLIELAPKSTRNPYYQGRIVDLVGRGNDKSKVVAQTRRLVELYLALKEDVAKRAGNTEADKKAKEDLAEAEELSESTIRKTAQVWNREAKKTRTPQVYKFAREMYEDYMKLFSGSRFAYEMRFQLADLYYKIEEFDRAATEYEAVVLADPKGKHLVDAANDNVLALEEHIKDLRLKKPKAAETPAEIHPEHKRLMAACDRYVQFVPADKADKLVAVKFKAAKIYYDYNHFDEALKRFDDIVLTDPKAEQAEVSANLALDVYNLRKDWEGLYKTARRFMSKAELVEGREKLAADLARFMEYSKFSLVQILEERVKKERGDLRLVADAYAEFYSEFPKSENADKALFNASVAFDKTGQKEKADELRRTMLERFPDSTLAADVAFYTAKQLEERTEYAEAAERYLAFSRKYPRDARARDALYNASVFYAGSGEVKTATKLREDYLKDFGRAKGGEKEAAAIYWSIAQDLDRAGRWKQAAEYYESYAKEFSDTPELWDALWREAQIRRDKLGQKSKAEDIEKALLGTERSWAKKGRSLPPSAGRHASMVAFVLVDKDKPEYERMRIDTPNVNNPTPFQRSLREKARGREQMIKRYTQVVTQYQQAESTIASLYRIAELWDDFVASLTRVPCPRGVAAEVCELIKQGIEEQAAPAREAAYQAYKTCVDKSNELNTFTAFSTKCVRALEKLAPQAYPQIVEKSREYRPPLALELFDANPLITEYDGFAVAREAQARANSPKETAPAGEPEERSAEAGGR